MKKSLELIDLFTPKYKPYQEEIKDKFIEENKPDNYYDISFKYKLKISRQIKENN